MAAKPDLPECTIFTSFWAASLTLRGFAEYNVGSDHHIFRLLFRI